MLHEDKNREVKEFTDGKEFFEYLQKNGKSRANASIDELYKEYLSATPKKEIKDIHTYGQEERNYTLYKDGRLECKIRDYNGRPSTLSFSDGEEFLNYLKNNDKLAAATPLDGMYEIYNMQKEEGEYFSVSKHNGKFEKHYLLNADNQLTCVTANSNEFSKTTFENGNQFIEYIKETNNIDSNKPIEKLYSEFNAKQNEVLQSLSIKLEDGSRRTLTLLGSGTLVEKVEHAEQNATASEIRYENGQEFLNYILANNKLNDKGDDNHNFYGLYNEFIESKKAPETTTPEVQAPEVEISKTKQKNYRKLQILLLPLQVQLLLKKKNQAKLLKNKKKLNQKQ